jgi:hypothetical protein
MEINEMIKINAMTTSTKYRRYKLYQDKDGALPS